MAIRMRPDENGGDEQPRIPNQPSGPRRSGGGGMLTMLLPLVFSLFRKNPKMAIGLIVIGGILYATGFLGGGDGGNTNIVSPYEQSMGFNHDEVKYGNTAVYEPLANNRKNPLPESYSLLEYAPTRLNQGRQGSCVGWSASYAARTILHARQTGARPNDVAFSPSYLYNQIALTDCQGAYLPDALAVMKKGGLLPTEYFPYDERSCSKKPDTREKQAAQQFRIRDYQRLTKGSASSQVPDLLAIKQNLAAGAPVVIGMLVGGTFMRNMEGQDLWRPTQQDYKMNGYGGHAMCVIGYDDYKAGANNGAFQIMNSWGTNWGNNGVAWVTYKDFEFFTKEAFGLYPMGSADKGNANFAAEFGLVKNKGKVSVAFEQTGENTFRTVTPMKKDEDFKIEVTNTQPCYTYVFGQETNGDIYTLFPYNEKHSPYCGTKGTRLFPRFESLYADDQGNLDYMGVIMSKEVIDYEQAKQALNNVNGTMAQKLKTVLGSNALGDMQFKAGKSIQMGTYDKKSGATYIVMEIEKE